jgi:hypothetical protein
MAETNGTVIRALVDVTVQIIFQNKLHLESHLNSAFAVIVSDASSRKTFSALYRGLRIRDKIRTSRELLKITRMRVYLSEKDISKILIYLIFGLPSCLSINFQSHIHSNYNIKHPSRKTM